MKSNLIIVLPVIAALVAGFLAGRFQAGRVWNRLFENNAYTAASNQAHFYILALTFLHEGHQTKAMDLLESLLDGSLLTFIPYENLRPEDRGESGLRAIQVAREYRAKHPWHRERPEIQDGVQRVLSVNK